MKKLIFIFLIFMVSLAVYSAPPEKRNFSSDSDYMIYHGKKLPSENSSHFRLVEIQTASSGDGALSVNLVFNRQINPSSVSAACFSVNGKVISGTKFKFSKDGMSVHVKISFNEELRSISVKDIKSYNGSKMLDENINNIEKNGRYRFSKELKKWKKS